MKHDTRLRFNASLFYITRYGFDPEKYLDDPAHEYHHVANGLVTLFDDVDKVQGEISNLRTTIQGGTLTSLEHAAHAIKLVCATERRIALLHAVAVFATPILIEANLHAAQKNGATHAAP